MNRVLTVALALALLNGTAMAQQDNPNRNDPGQNRDQQDRNDQDRNRRPPATQGDQDRTRRATPATPAVPATQSDQNRARRATPATPATQSDQDRARRATPATPATPATRSDQDRARRATPATPATPNVQQQDRSRVVPAAPSVQQQDRNRAPSVQDQDRNRVTPADRDRQDQNRDRIAPPSGRDQDRNRDVRNEPDRRGDTRWSRGDRLPEEYRRNRQYVVNDWQYRGLRRPPRGYYWVRNDANDFFLAALATGFIAEVLYRDQWEQRWSRRYSRAYTYNDDVYYQECRNSPDPAGVIAGALIGGLLGNVAGQGGGGATIAGVIVGGAVGAALTSNLDCEDRSYAYRAYYDGFNSGRPGSRYRWRNPSNDHSGEFLINGYYYDPDNFRCARYTQTIYIGGRPQQARGVACRQSDGSWAIVR